jgi:hypothetical protein
MLEASLPPVGPCNPSTQDLSADQEALSKNHASWNGSFFWMQAVSF